MSVLVLECAKFASLVYAKDKKYVPEMAEVSVPVPHTNASLWEPIFNYNMPSGDDAAVVRGWRRGTDVVVAAKGTTITSMADLKADAQLGLYKTPDMAGVAKRVEKLAAAHIGGGHAIIFTGHSLGGNIAQHLAAECGPSVCRYVTFSAPGMNREANLATFGVNIVGSHDHVPRRGGGHLGPTYLIDTGRMPYLRHKMNGILTTLATDPIGSMTIDRAIAFAKT